MKQIITIAIALLCLIQVSVPQTTTCEEGYYLAEYDDGNFIEGVTVLGTICRQCPRGCVTCDEDGFCTQMIDVNGITVTGTGADAVYTPFCQWAAYPSWTAQIGYNIETDRCEYCAEGCTRCFVDYDKCTACLSGYEYHRESLTCVKAGLGLGAAVLGLSVLMLIATIIGCWRVVKS